VSRSLLYTDVAARLLLRPLVRLGYWQFERSGVTPKSSYASFRKLHCVTRGEINREMSARIVRPPPTFTLGDGDAIPARALPGAIAALDRDGYHVLPDKLDRTICDELVAFATRTPAHLVPGATTARFDASAPRAPRYQFLEPALLGSSAVRRLLADPSLMALAAQYLRTSPINDLVTMWWSAPFGAASSEAAQLFHFDMDRIRFLKFFVYLTDVTAETGPHVYVRGSHREKPGALYRDRRFADDEVARAFPAEDIREITGPAGTIIVADTSGIHKGKPLATGARLVFQLEFTSSLFGQTYDRHRPALSEVDPLGIAIRRYPTVLRRFT
jgi:hypothetical protein